MKKAIYLIILTSLSHICFAQTNTISGQIIDEFSSEGLAYTNIGILGKSGGSVSNPEGFFVLSIEGALSTDSISFSFIGYEPLRLAINEFSPGQLVRMTKRAVELNDISVMSRELTPAEILDLMRLNYKKNHPTVSIKQKVFCRDATYTTIRKSDLTYKKSSFNGIDRSFVDQFNEKMPEQLDIYSDNLVDMYYGKTGKKIVHLQGQTLMENWNFNDEFTKQLNQFGADVEDGLHDQNGYYKVRSGIFAGKVDFGSDTAFVLEEDSFSVTMSTDYLQGDINYLRRHYSTIDSKHWDFFSDYKYYDYTLRDVAIINDELAYVIDFAPRRRKGKYTGTLCVATNSYALLQVDYAFAEDKDGVGVSMLGVTYSVDDRRGRAIYEKRGNAHYLKYLYRESHEQFGMNRTLSLIYKEENGLFDKKKQEVKIKLDADATFVQKKELLVVSQETISEDEFSNIDQTKTFTVNKVSEYTPEMWENTTIIEPSRALKEYKKQF